MDADDGHPEATPARELAEETGYTANSRRLLAQPPTSEPSETVSVMGMPVHKPVAMALNGDPVPV
jgi:8-oxo-dGTP pyrophosphatase MutT (NUDIX family)